MYDDVFFELCIKWKIGGYNFILYRRDDLSHTKYIQVIKSRVTPCTHTLIIKYNTNNYYNHMERTGRIFHSIKQKKTFHISL